MTRRAFSTLLLMVTFSAIFAQKVNERDLENPKSMKSIQITSLEENSTYKSEYAHINENLNDVFTEKLDSMVVGWYVQNVFQKDNFENSSELNLPSINDTQVFLSNSVPDSVYVERLNDMNSLVDMSYNGTIKNFIKLYTERRKSSMNYMLGLSEYYFPMFEEVLDKYDMPLELKYMAIIESALNARAYSRAGACGLWQFMYATGKGYGLEISSYVDERRDPLKSTDAAARFLKDLYGIYKNWHLVIAAYNCGPGNVNKAIRRAGGTRDYWKIYYNLPRETRGYVPSFIGAAYAMNYAKEYGMKPSLPKFPIVTDTLHVNQYLHFQQISVKLNIPIEQLRDLNPQYRKDIIPASSKKSYTLRLPSNKIGEYIDLEQRIFAYERSKYFPNNSLVEIGNRNSNSSYAVVGDVSGKDKVYYTVKSGDNVGFIATWFHIRSNDLRYWNNIRRNMIREGQRLVIYVPKGKGNNYKKLNTMSFTQKQKSVGKTSTVSVSKKKATALDSNYLYHTVRKGDTIWEIAQKYSGVTQSDLMKLNNLNSRSKLQLGQKLKVKHKA